MKIICHLHKYAFCFVFTILLLLTALCLFLVEEVEKTESRVELLSPTPNICHLSDC